MKKLLVVLAIAISLCAIEFVDATVSESSLLSIYNEEYDTSYESLDPITVTNDNIWVRDDGDLEIAYVGEWAEYTHKFGYYTDLGSGSERKKIGKKGKTKGLSPGDSFGWYLDTKENNSTWYSETSLNSDGFGHLTTLNGTDGSYLLGWEDLIGGGDQDHNDYVTKVEQGASPAPEPASLLLVASVLGIAGIGYGRTRSRQRNDRR